MSKETLDDLGAVRILVETLTNFDEAEQSRVIRWACEKLGNKSYTNASQKVSLQTEVFSTQEAQSFDGPQTVIAPQQTVKDIKTFIDEKDPQNDKQLAAVVAYYHAFEAPLNSRKTSINSDDIVEACRLAQRQRPTRAIQTLVNAAHTGFLDKAEESGAYKLNAVGENLVAMTLPGTLQKKTAPKRKSTSKKVVKKVAAKKPKKVVKKTK